MNNKQFNGIYSGFILSLDVYRNLFMGEGLNESTVYNCTIIGVVEIFSFKGQFSYLIKL
jgi:hypothetical protein